MECTVLRAGNHRNMYSWEITYICSENIHLLQLRITHILIIFLITDKIIQTNERELMKCNISAVSYIYSKYSIFMSSYAPCDVKEYVIGFFEIDFKNSMSVGMYVCIQILV